MGKNKPPNFDAMRHAMVEEQLKQRHINDKRVLHAMGKIPRHFFVPPELQSDAYNDSPLPIGLDQTISQPYMVALMTELLELRGDEIVLEIGTGSGYQTAILAELAGYVYSIERHADLANQAWQRLKALGCTNVSVAVGDGTFGYKNKAPFDAILVAATGPTIPDPLRNQMAEGACMILPVGKGEEQHLLRVRRKEHIWNVEKILKVRFVPLLGKYGFVAD